MTLGIVILAAGKGTRMQSDIPKALHKLAGKFLLDHVVDLAESLNPSKIVIVHGHESATLKRNIVRQGVLWAEQEHQLGTGHAVKQALQNLKEVDRVLILYCDVPLLKTKTLKKLISDKKNNLCIATATMRNPEGYGRIIRNSDGKISKIIEQNDLSLHQQKIKEINTGIMLVPSGQLAECLEKINNNNIAGEYYLTDIVDIAVLANQNVSTFHVEDADEIMGINTKSQLARAERIWQFREAHKLMNCGMTIMDPNRFDLRGTIKHGANCIIDINVIIEGEVFIGNNVSIGANTVLKNVKLGNDVKILENCVLEETIVGSDCAIGPFSRLRPGANLSEGAHIGNFVEIKESKIGKKTKVNHLTYLGNATIGEEVNIGAGTITCNFDGASKHSTTIGNNVFIGSNTALVAPLIVGDGATIGAGSTIGKDAPKGKLTLSRPDQITVENWDRPSKEREENKNK